MIGCVDWTNAVFEIPVHSVRHERIIARIKALKCVIRQTATTPASTLADDVLAAHGRGLIALGILASARAQITIHVLEQQIILALLHASIGMSSVTIVGTFLIAGQTELHTGLGGLFVGGVLRTLALHKVTVFR